MLFQGLGQIDKLTTHDITSIVSFPSYQSPLTDGFIRIPKHVTNVRLDVGLSETAHISQYWLDHDPDTFVLCLEPNRRNLVRIISGTGRWIYKLDPKLIDIRCYILPYAAKDIPEPARSLFYCTANDPGCSSLLQPIEFDIAKESYVECINLAQLIGLISPKRFPFIDYIKLDCQGADYEILRSLRTVASRISVITYEYEPGQYYNSCDSLYKYSSLMTSLGLLEATSENLIKWRIDPGKFLVDDPTYFNPLSAAFISASARMYIQSNSFISKFND